MLSKDALNTRALIASMLGTAPEPSTSQSSTTTKASSDSRVAALPPAKIPKLAVPTPLPPIKVALAPAPAGRAPSPISMLFQQKQDVQPSPVSLSPLATSTFRPASPAPRAGSPLPKASRGARSPSPSGLQDEFYKVTVQNLIKAGVDPKQAKDICIRCKEMECKGHRFCIFEKNVFIAGLCVPALASRVHAPARAAAHPCPLTAPAHSGAGSARASRAA